MKVKEILIKVFNMLEIHDWDKYLNEDEVVPEDVSNEIDKMILSLNIVNGNIASQYFEIIESKEVDVLNNFIPYYDISDKNIIEIKNVTNINGSPIKYKITNAGIELKVNKAIINYSYFPKDVLVSDDIDYYTKINEYVMAQGVISEYLFLKGDFEESYIWDKRFKNSINSLMRPKRNIVTPAKRWL